MKNFYQSDLNKLFILELFTVLLISIGSIDRLFSFGLLAIISVFFFTKPFMQSLQLFLLSLPLFIALPLFPFTDSISIWRPLSLLLITRWLWERRDILWIRPLIFWEELLKRKRLLYLTIAWFALVGMSILSLLWANDIGAGLKGIIYLANIYAILFMYAWEITYNDLPVFLHRASLVNGVILGLGFFQFALTFLLPLFDLWQWWALYPIYAFYGQDTSALVARSNTWFSYYGSEEIPATLRMFSIFQDSHAFAMAAIFGAAVWATWYVIFKERGDTRGIRLSIGLLIANLLGIALSGSRGAWMGAFLFAAAIALVMALKNRSPHIPAVFLKKGFALLVIFFLMFPVSTVLLATSQQAQLMIEGRAGAFDLGLAFWRARTTFDIDELSNKGRLEIWKDSFQFLKERSFLRGSGIGNFSTVLQLRSDASRLGASAHSLYLQVFTELGLGGFIIFLAVLTIILWQGYMRILYAPEHLTRGYAFAFTFAFLWILLYSLVDVTLFNDKIFLLAAILIGMLYALSEKKSI